MFQHAITVIGFIVVLPCLLWAGEKSVILIESDCITSGIENNSKTFDDLKNAKITMSCDFKTDEVTCWRLDKLKNGTFSRAEKANWIFKTVMGDGDKFYLQDSHNNARLLIDFKKENFKLNLSAYDFKNSNLIERQCKGKIIPEIVYLKNGRTGSKNDKESR